MCKIDFDVGCFTVNSIKMIQKIATNCIKIDKKKSYTPTQEEHCL
jgi:cell fate (sporulation/competence/biofilm development) regulator YmcA (YheA/YmcA/DUF963 family)